MFSVLAPLNHTDAHSLFRSPSYVNMKMYASLVLSIALLNIGLNATGQDLLTEIEGHVLHKHKDLLRCVRTLGLTKPTVGKYSKEKIYVNILLSNDNLFFEACEVMGDAFYYIIQYIGPEKEASQLKYKFVLESVAEEIIVCNVASSYSTDVKEEYSTGKCVKLFCDTIERFLDEDRNLKFHVELLKFKEEPKQYYSKA